MTSGFCLWNCSRPAFINFRNLVRTPRKIASPDRAGTPASAKVRARFLIWLLVGLLGLLTIALYWPATGHDFVNYDDQLYVTANPHVQAGLNWEGVKWVFCHQVANNWHPLTVLSHMLDCQLFGLNPGDII